MIKKRGLKGQHNGNEKALLGKRDLFCPFTCSAAPALREGRGRGELGGREEKPAAVQDGRTGLQRGPGY